MKTALRMTLTRAVWSGGAAGLASALAAAAGAKRSRCTPYAALNAVTHCLWQDAALREDAVSVRYTGLGASIHLGSAVFWGVLFEALCGRDARAGKVAAAAATTAAVAYVVDYHVVPDRLTPGFEVHLSRQALGLTYLALAAGFAAAALARSNSAR
ncbi:hypothetical protein AWB81_05332 [Caballeronia arationis]|jgi:hypothetical protein|uniref:hypothetical protein n=1 Tax=Caballeronia arationis TaxID=1777142 RepID=UPI00074B55F2|nr:hypothetical protein [Caballeronia arationis]SAK95915.1 hypothetical protein AWB81_05332 [Caballeronia arationis]